MSALPTFPHRIKKVGTSDMELAKNGAPGESLHRKLFWGEEEQ